MLLLLRRLKLYSFAFFWFISNASDFYSQAIHQLHNIHQCKPRVFVSISCWYFFLSVAFIFFFLFSPSLFHFCTLLFCSLFSCATKYKLLLLLFVCIVWNLVWSRVYVCSCLSKSHPCSQLRAQNIELHEMTTTTMTTKLLVKENIAINNNNEQMHFHSMKIAWNRSILDGGNGHERRNSDVGYKWREGEREMGGERRNQKITWWNQIWEYRLQ